ncbi:MAG: hypothetical protein ABIK97_05535 [candidate division WOR-3 bacterium]
MNETEKVVEEKKFDTERINAFIDVIYLYSVTIFYIMSLIYPLFGIIFGLILQNAGKTPSAKRIGKICLILGIINIVICLIFLIAMLVSGITQMSKFFTPRI